MPNPAIAWSRSRPVAAASRAVLKERNYLQVFAEQFGGHAVKERIGAVGRETMAPHLLYKNAQPMKKNSQILKPAQKLSLGDLILAVSSCTKNTKETVAAVANLLASGQVRVESEGRLARARVC
jgi:hypothetical protein